MSTDSSRSPKGISESQNGDLDPLSRKLPVRFSRDLPSQSLPDLKPVKSKAPSVEQHPYEAEIRLALSPRKVSTPKSVSLSNIRSQSDDRSSADSRGSSPSVASSSDRSKLRQTIVKSFAPRVVVHASSDTEELIRTKGFEDGLEGLIKPYGEDVQGKVIIRDSNGGSKAWDDFGIRIISPQRLRVSSTYQPASDTLVSESKHSIDDPQSSSRGIQTSQVSDLSEAIDQILDTFLQRPSVRLSDHGNKKLDDDSLLHSLQSDSLPVYSKYLRKILSSIPAVPYESFAHPVACLIAITSHHPAPIEALRKLYADTGHAGDNIPPWVDSDYLRYYVLIHDEEKDDIVKSTALFDLMKRHFGLHCHLLRLRSSECVETDDDSVGVPACLWLSASQELELKRVRDLTEENDTSRRYIFESDATAIRALIREMVTQSILPFMENRVMKWNDQVASRRRGISGRFMSLSKRWAGFGSKSAVSGSVAAPNSAGSNYNYRQGFYAPETPEATMRQLGDYAFMLRDWRLAYSTYDMLRTDFSHDKAWSYHAAANEMAAITALLNPQTHNTRSRSETIDQMLDAAAYSYLTRCSLPMNIVRCLTVAVELLKDRGPSYIDDATHWGGRLLELNVLTPMAQTLISERLSDCYGSVVAKMPDQKSRKRQGALWSLLASESWLRLEKSAQARSRLMAARALYEFDDCPEAVSSFSSEQLVWTDIEKALHCRNGSNTPSLIDLDDYKKSIDSTAPAIVEQLNDFTQPALTTNVDREGFIQQDPDSSMPRIFDETHSS